MCFPEVEATSRSFQARRSVALWLSEVVLITDNMQPVSRSWFSFKRHFIRPKAGRGFHSLTIGACGVSMCVHAVLMTSYF